VNAEQTSKRTQRVLAATELRELRSLFVATGFGDVLSPPSLPEGLVPARPATALPPRYSPAFLDLLLESWKRAAGRRSCAGATLRAIPRNSGGCSHDVRERSAAKCPELRS
jgi:hypothetical protein